MVLVSEDHVPSELERLSTGVLPLWPEFPVHQNMPQAASLHTCAYLSQHREELGAVLAISVGQDA